MSNQYLKDRNLVEAITLKALANGYNVDSYDESGEHFQSIADIHALRDSIEQLDMLDIVMTNKQTDQGHSIVLVNNNDSLIADFDCELEENEIFAELVAKYES